MLTQQRLQEVLHYCPETGIFTWHKHLKHCRAGMKAGTKFKPKKSRVSYTNIKVDNVIYLAHRLAFLYMTGEFPAGLLDHKDEDGENNEWLNLRECTKAQNLRNISIVDRNTSGIKGVSRHKKNGSWVAYVTFEDKRYHLGSFKTKEEAGEIVARKRNELHGEFANHG